MSFSLVRVHGVVCAMVVAGIAFVPQVGASEEPFQRLTIQQAIDEAYARSPVLQARRTEVEQAEARFITGKTYPHDPEIILEGAQRDNDVETNFDRGVRVAQVIEIGGQRRRRVATASAELDAARAHFLREERLLAARVRAAFVEALRVRELVGIEQANAELARSLAEVARKRFEHGAVAQMEVNLAQVQVGRAERDLRLTQGAYEVARSLLAEVVGLDPIRPPLPEGGLELPPRVLPPVPDIISSALARRADLQSFRHATEAARARIELERRAVVPNLAVEAFYGSEDGTDRLIGGGIGIRIPIFNRNRGPIAEARATERQAIAETEATELQVRQEVAASLARYRASKAAAENLEQRVLGTLDENLKLLQRSFESGKTGWTDVLVFRREFVDVQRDYIETLTDARLSGIELDLAAADSSSDMYKESQP